MFLLRLHRAIAIDMEDQSMTVVIGNDQGHRHDMHFVSKAEMNIGGLHLHLYLEDHLLYEVEVDIEVEGVDLVEVSCFGLCLALVQEPGDSIESRCGWSRMIFLSPVQSTYHLNCSCLSSITCPFRITKISSFEHE
jgi:hypothetical protein